MTDYENPQVYYFVEDEKEIYDITITKTLSAYLQKPKNDGNPVNSLASPLNFDRNHLSNYGMSDNGNQWIPTDEETKFMFQEVSQNTPNIPMTEESENNGLLDFSPLQDQ